MKAAVEEAARTGRTRHPKLAAIAIAREINTRLGGAVMAPWQIDELPEDWLDVFAELADAGRSVQRKQKLEGLFERWRRQHPSYTLTQ